ncbi:MAG: cysteine-S-conjugate beta-lyase [Campylobacterota bacterium]|nr:cysteine-S-conjugate beta-lyase [Campylobacterota bacterium]
MPWFEAIDRSGTYSVKFDEAKQKFGTNDLLPLWVADMDLASPQCVQGAIQKRALHPLYGYTSYPEAYYEAIQIWMQKRFNWKIEKEWIVPAYGVVSSINFALGAYSKEGDSILIQTPLYPPFAASVRRKKRRILDNTLRYSDGKYEIDFNDFEAKAKEAKIFLLCSPHNPTTRAWSKEELEEMIEICIRYDVLIVADEIHADVVYKKKHYPLGSFEKMTEKCIVLNAPSKAFNVAGLNTSYAIIAGKKARKAYLAEQAKLGLSNGNPFGIEALMAAYTDGDEWLEALKKHLAANIAFVKTFLKEHALPIKAVATEATFLMWLDCRGLDLSQALLVDFFVKKARLGLNDGMSFGESGKGFMRLNVGTSRIVLEEAMQRLLAAYKERS